MRYLDVTLQPERGYFHEFDKILSAEPTITPEAIHQINLMDDETMVLLYELGGESESVETFLEDHFEAITYQTSQMGQNQLVYAHLKPSSMVCDLLHVPRQCGIVLEYPMVFLEEGTLQVTVVGEESALQEAIASVSQEVRTDIVRLGSYAPAAERLFTKLTDRQQEILLTAIDLGYYDVPREATYQEIAENVGLTVTTVGEHLRKIESTILREITASQQRAPAPA